MYSHILKGGRREGPQFGDDSVSSFSPVTVEFQSSFSPASVQVQPSINPVFSPISVQF